MSENRKGSTFKLIGVLAIIFGVLVSVIMGIATESLLTIFAGSAGFIISGLFFMGFSEVIGLLQAGVDKQAEILARLNEKASELTVKDFRGCAAQEPSTAADEKQG